jgi:putative DNA primase/helicase
MRYDLPRADALQALQRIAADGSKRFTKGLQKPGVCLRLGLVVAGEPLLVCEGYATGLTLRMALGRRLPVFGWHRSRLRPESLGTPER